MSALEHSADSLLQGLRKCGVLSTTIFRSSRSHTHFIPIPTVFIAEITARAFIVADSNKRRTLSRADIAKALSKSDQFDFLIDIVPREDGFPGAGAGGANAGHANVAGGSGHPVGTSHAGGSGHGHGHSLSHSLSHGHPAKKPKRDDVSVLFIASGFRLFIWVLSIWCVDASLFAYRTVSTTSANRKRKVLTWIWMIHGILVQAWEDKLEGRSS